MVVDHLMVAPVVVAAVVAVAVELLAQHLRQLKVTVAVMRPAALPIMVVVVVAVQH
jgi:hypothetical protein